MEIVLIKYLSIGETGIWTLDKNYISIGTDPSQKLGLPLSQEKNGEEKREEKIIFQVVAITKMEVCV